MAHTASHTDSTAPLRVLVLTRKSQGDNEETHADQERICREYIERDPSLVFADVWNEHKVSGAKNWRTRKIGLAVESVKEGKYDAIMHAWEDRISREGLEAAIEIWRVMGEAGAVYISADGVDSRKEDAEDFFHLKAVLANMQLKRYRKGSNMGRERAVIKHGVHGGDTPPLGYTWTERSDGTINAKGAIKHGPLAPSEPEAGRVRRAFERFGAEEDWASWAEVRAILGVPSIGNARSILKNPVYLGTAKSGDARKEHAHPALISREVFDRVQRRLGKQSEDYASRTRGPATLLELTKVLRCSCCHNVLTPKRTRRGNAMYVGWFCKRAIGKEKGSGMCSGIGSVANNDLLAFTIGTAQGWHAASHPSYMLGREADKATLTVHEEALAAAKSAAQVWASDAGISFKDIPAGSKYAIAIRDAETAIAEYEMSQGWIARSPEAVAEMLAKGDPAQVNEFLRESVRIIVGPGPGSHALKAARAVENRVKVLYLDGGLTAGGENPETFLPVPETAETEVAS